MEKKKKSDTKSTYLDQRTCILVWILSDLHSDQHDQHLLDFKPQMWAFLIGAAACQSVDI